MDTINGSSSMNDNYKLSQDELDKIIEGVDELHYNFDTIWEAENAPIKCIVGSKDLNSMDKYRDFLLKELPNIYEYAFEIEQSISPGDTSCAMEVNMEYSPDDDAKLIEVAKFICETAKSRGCNYGGYRLDAIFTDDPRVQHNC